MSYSRVDRCLVLLGFPLMVWLLAVELPVQAQEAGVVKQERVAALKQSLAQN